MIVPALVLLFLQILLGALVAGADAGRAYADWPTIGGELFPASYGALSPWWVNLIENHATLQFNHRMLGYVVAGHLAATGYFAWREGGPDARRIGLGIIALVAAQIVLGVATVLAGAPLWLSLLHQGGAIALWAACVALARLRFG